jgi:predicted nucleic acid-binding protein
VVVDTSIAVKWYLPEKGSEEAARLRTAWELAGSPIIMPELVRVEFANAIWSHKQLRPEEKKNIVSRFLDVPFEILPVENELVEKALELAIELDATVYDCIYLALAIFARSRLVTADVQFAKKAQGYPVEVLKCSSA